MARPTRKTKNKDHTVTDEQTQGLPAMSQAADILTTVKDDYSTDRDLINQMLGQIQMSDAISKFANVVSLQKLKHIKENKLYRAMAGGIATTDESKPPSVGTWEGFCLAIGTTRQKVDEDLLNLRAFGEEALDDLTRVGAGYRELRQLRKLPDDELEAAKEIAASDDKEGLIEFITDMAAKHNKEKEELKKSRDELQKDAEANERMLVSKNSKIDKLDKKVHDLQSRTRPWDQRCNDINIEVASIASGLLEYCDQLSVMRQAILTEDFGDDNSAAIEMMAVFYHDAMMQVTAKIDELMGASEESFAGYKV